MKNAKLKLRNQKAQTIKDGAETLSPKGRFPNFVRVVINLLKLQEKDLSSFVLLSVCRNIL